MLLRLLSIAALVSAMAVLLFGCSIVIDDVLNQEDHDKSASEQIETGYIPSLYLVNDGLYTPSHNHSDGDDEKTETGANTKSDVDVGNSGTDKYMEDDEEIENQAHVENNDVNTEKEQIPMKQIALTFDDGPDEAITPIILELLAQYNAKATFFMLGYRVNLYPEIVNQVHDAGHEIGNHSWNHPQLTKLKPALILEQIEKTDNAIAELVGFAPTLVRPPYGNVNKKVIDTVPGTLVNWSIDTSDWRDRDVDMIMNNLERQIHEDGIILMHDTYETTAQAVEQILAKYTEEGYEFVTVSELLEFDLAEPVSGKIYTRKDESAFSHEP